MITADTITDEQIRELQRTQDTYPIGPYWSTCVDALSDEWHEADAGARAHNRERAEARARCAEILNAADAIRIAELRKEHSL